MIMQLLLHGYTGSHIQRLDRGAAAAETTLVVVPVAANSKVANYLRLSGPHSISGFGATSTENTGTRAIAAAAFAM
jgi:hypothetical protein